jgi:hypothetical protein
MKTTPTTVQELLDYWTVHIPYKGRLISPDGTCMCAQGQALHYLGNMSVEELRVISQGDADRQVAEIFGISLGQSILLRIVNDELDGAPSNVIRNPELVLGSQTHIILAFWSHLDGLTKAEWEGVADRAAAGAVAPGEAAKIAPWSAAGEAAWEAAYEVVWTALGAVAPWRAARIAAGATNEIQGASVMRAKNLPFYFLPLFGFADPEAVWSAMAADKK